MTKWIFAKHKNPGSLTGLGEPNGTCPTHWWPLTNTIESYKDNASITPWPSLRVTTVWTSLGNNLMWGGYQISDEMGFCSTGRECVGSDTVHKIVLLLTSDWSRSYKSPMFERCYFGSSWRLVETVASLRRLLASGGKQKELPPLLWMNSGRVWGVRWRWADMGSKHFGDLETKTQLRIRCVWRAAMMMNNEHQRTCDNAMIASDSGASVERFWDVSKRAAPPSGDR